MERRWCSEALCTCRIARLELGCYACGHAVQAQRCSPPSHSQGSLPRPEPAGVRGGAEAPRRPDIVTGRGGQGWMASPAAEHARRPAWYSDTSTELVLILPPVFHLTLRQAEGFARSVLRLLGQDLLAASDYA